MTPVPSTVPTNLSGSAPEVYPAQRAPRRGRRSVSKTSLSASATMSPCGGSTSTYTRCR